jgi:hypothetical protein
MRDSKRQAKPSQNRLITAAASLAWVSKSMCEASNQYTWHFEWTEVISFKDVRLTNQSKRPCKHKIGQVTSRSRSRLSTRSTSKARARRIWPGKLESTCLREARSSGPADEPNSTASTMERGTALSSETIGANRVGKGRRTKLDARITPATRPRPARRPRSRSAPKGLAHDSKSLFRRALHDKGCQLIIICEPVDLVSDQLNTATR